MVAAGLGPGLDGNHAPGQVHAGAAWRACIRLQTPAPGSRGMHSPLLPNAGAPCGTEFRDCAASTALIRCLGVFSRRGILLDRVPSVWAESELGGLREKHKSQRRGRLFCAKNQNLIGWDCVCRAIAKSLQTTVLHRDLSCPLTKAWLTPQLSGLLCPPAGTPMSAPRPSLPCWSSPSEPLSLKERTCVRKSWESHFWLL